MSNFLPDIASWALRGGAGNNMNNTNSNNSTAGGTTHNNNNNNNDNNDDDDDDKNNNNNKKNNKEQGDDDNNNNKNDNNNNNNNRVLTPEQMRAQRLARMEKQQQQQQQQGKKEEEEEETTTSSSGAVAAKGGGGEVGGAVVPMDIDNDNKKMNDDDDDDDNDKKPAAVDSSSSSSLLKKPPPPSSSPMETTETTTMMMMPKKRKGVTTTTSEQQSSSTTSSITSRIMSSSSSKGQRKKEFMLQKVLHVVLKGGSLVTSTTSSSNQSSYVLIDLGDGDGDSSSSSTPPPDITVQNVAEILATRLSMTDPTTTEHHHHHHHSNNDAAIASSATTTTRRQPHGSSRTTSSSSRSQLQQPHQLSLIQYLGQCHRRSGEELRVIMMQQQKQKSKITTTNNNNNNNKATITSITTTTTEEIVDILQEIQRQVVSYAASCIIEPDLFAWSIEAPIQLAHSLLRSVTADDISQSITFGIHGPTTSFYYLLCEELIQQQSQMNDDDHDDGDAAGGGGGGVLERTVRTICEYFMSKLAKCDSVLDNGLQLDGIQGISATQTIDGGGGGSSSAVVIVSAFTALCQHKRCAQAICTMKEFLLPEPDTIQATQMIRPTLPNNNNNNNIVGPGSSSSNINTNPTQNIFQMIAAAAAAASPNGGVAGGVGGGGLFTPPYAKRSGVALEKHTVLGSIMRIGIPSARTNPGFSPTTILRQSLDSVERTCKTQRQPYMLYQDTIHIFVMSLIKSSITSRTIVMNWFRDALVVNYMASSLQPDISKVSSTTCLQNITMELLKLCEPFMDDTTKHYLIDPRFISSQQAHGGVYAMVGDHAIPRLGQQQQQQQQQSSSDDNNDNNGVVPMDVTTTTDAATTTTTTTTTTTAAAAAAAAANNVDVVDDYNPKNTFIPKCFFFCSRSLHYSIVPQLSYHERLLRQISHLHWHITTTSQQQNNNNNNNPAAIAMELQNDPQFSILVCRQRSNEVALFHEEYIINSLRFCNLSAKVLYTIMTTTTTTNNNKALLASMPEDLVDDICDIVMRIAKLKPKLLGSSSIGSSSSSSGGGKLEFKYVFKLVVKLLSEEYANMVRNYNLRAKLGDVLYEVFMPSSVTGSSSSNDDDRRDVPMSVCTDPMKGGQTYLLSDEDAQETLAPSLLLLYGEVEHTGYYDKMSHRAKISTLIKYLWDSVEHRDAFKRITENKTSFIKSANGIINETNTLIATVMQKLPEIKIAQEKIKNTAEFNKLSQDEQKQIMERLDENEREVRHALPLSNKTIHMFGYLNTDPDIRNLFLLDELCNRLVEMLAHVLTKLVGSKGLDLKVDNPESYEFRPKEMLRDLCAIFALFSNSTQFQIQCAKSQVSSKLLQTAVKTCKRLNLLHTESMNAFESLPMKVNDAASIVERDEQYLKDAPDEFLDEILSTYMIDPVLLPSGHYVDRSTITQHLLNDPIDPFNREPLSLQDIKPATELKLRMDEWLSTKKKRNEQQQQQNSSTDNDNDMNQG